jgi:zinc finger BED domain-containing protein 5/7/8/9
MHQDPTQIIAALPLSDTSVQRRIDEMAVDVEDQLLYKLRKRKFSLQLDESTLSDNSALLLSYVRFFDDDFNLQEEMLFARKLATDTTGESIFNTLKDYFDEHQIDINNITSCATDGAPSMVGRQRGFLAHLKKLVPDVFSIHCVVHRQHLVAKCLQPTLHQSLNLVIKAINKIKAHPKNDRLFKQLCCDNDEQYQRLLLHTEVRWLSKGNCLARFIELYDSILQFFEVQKEADMALQLKNVKIDIFYLASVYRKFNDLNLQLQGKKVTLIEVKKFISAFIDKLVLYRRNLLRKEYYQFPELTSLENEISTHHIERYSEHLLKVKADMESRFSDVIQLKIDPWMVDPFLDSDYNEEIDIQEELMELQHDEESQAYFRNGGYLKMWQRVGMASSYPKLWAKMHSLLLAFPTSYLVECGFSAALNLITNQRNRLDIIERGDLRLYLTKIKVNLDSIVRQHQAQGSH